MEESYTSELNVMRDEIKRLNEKLKDKEEVISMNRKLISHYEKELGLKTGE